jgi:hypothetical protein
MQLIYKGTVKTSKGNDLNVNSIKANFTVCWPCILNYICKITNTMHWLYCDSVLYISGCHTADRLISLHTPHNFVCNRRFIRRESLPLCNPLHNFVKAAEFAARVGWWMTGPNQSVLRIICPILCTTSQTEYRGCLDIICPFWTHFCSIVAHRQSTLKETVTICHILHVASWWWAVWEPEAWKEDSQNKAMD